MEDRHQLLGHIEASLVGLGISGPVLASIIGYIRAHAYLPQPAAPPPPPSTAQIARSFYRSSLKRTEVLGGRIVADGAWNMLLDLFASVEEDRPVSISSACIASGGPITTAHRQLGLMQDNGLLQRLPDMHDNRRQWVELTAGTQQLMRDLIDSFCQPIKAL